MNEVTLGPVRCQGCGSLVVWITWLGWVHPVSRLRHNCRVSSKYRRTHG